jgi:ATP-dependent RNA helicase RhlE
MLDMGFINDIRKVLKELPEKNQTLFFSATMSPEINKLAKSLLYNPIHVAITPQATTVEKIEQRLFYVDKSDKDGLLLKLMGHEHLKSVLIFTRTKYKANRVAAFLSKNNISADAIHGNKSQNSRTRAIANFKSGKIKVLVATDIAARGIDIDQLPHVVNYELPNVPEDYVHRIGRTGRAGQSGEAVSLVCVDEHKLLFDIEKFIKTEIKKVHIEAFTPDPSIQAEPIQNGRGGGQKRGGGSRNGSKQGSNSRNRKRENNKKNEQKTTKPANVKPQSRKQKADKSAALIGSRIQEKLDKLDRRDEKVEDKNKKNSRRK